MNVWRGHPRPRSLTTNSWRGVFGFNLPNYPITKLLNFLYSSGGSSKSTRLPRKPFVFHAPKAIPSAIQIAPKTRALGLKLIQRKKQITKPSTGGARLPNFFSG